jgi:arylsulfatase A-like enzyme
VVLVSIDGLAAYELGEQYRDVELPRLRELAASGVIAESSETVFPSLTHPSHTTLVTGVLPIEHGVIGNRLRNRETGESFHITNVPHSQSVMVPTIFDAAKASGLRTGSFYWPETFRDPSIDDNIPEVFQKDVPTADPSAADPAFLSELRSAGVPIDLYYRWYLDQNLKGASDAALAEAAAYVIRERQPHFLAIHFLVVDEIQHSYGTQHYRSYHALTSADHALGIVIDAVSEAGLADGTAFFVVSDHGFQTLRHEVNLHPLFARHDLLDKVKLHPDSWTVHIELGEDFDTKTDTTRLQSLLDEALALPGVARWIASEDYPALGYPRFEDDPHVRGHFMVIGELDTFLTIDPSSDSTERREREPYHGHGYLPSHPSMFPAFVASGAGIRRGARIGHVRNLDVAPTIAHLLGLELPGAKGRVLTELLED